MLLLCTLEPLVQIGGGFVCAPAVTDAAMGAGKVAAGVVFRWFMRGSGWESGNIREVWGQEGQNLGSSGI